LTITDIAVGDGVNTLDPSATGLVNEVYRDTASTPIRSTTYADTLVFELNIPPTTGGFTTREIGAFDSDGDLIAVGTLDEVVKPVDGINLTVRINVKLSSSSDVDVFYDNAGAISHSGLRDRNAVDAHDASAISTDDGGTVQDAVINNFNVAAANSTLAKNRIQKAGQFTVGGSICILGDSITVGEGATALTNSYASRVFDSIADYLSGGYGVTNEVNFNWTSMGNVALSGQTAGTSGPIKRSQIISVGGTITIARANASKVAFYYDRTTTSGSVEIRQNGVLLNTINCSGANQKTVLSAYTDVAIGGASIQFKVINNPVEFLAIVPIKDNAKQPNVMIPMRMAVSGWNSEDFVDFDQVVSIGTCGAIGTTDSIYALAVGTNDIYTTALAPDTYISNLKYIGETLQSFRPSNVILLVVPPKSNEVTYPPAISGYTHEDYRLALYALAAEKKWPIIDHSTLKLSERSMLVDGLHPSDDGHRAMAENMLSGLGLRETPPLTLTQQTAIDAKSDVVMYRKKADLTTFTGTTTREKTLTSLGVTASDFVTGVYIRWKSTGVMIPYQDCQDLQNGVGLQMLRSFSGSDYSVAKLFYKSTLNDGTGFASPQGALSGNITNTISGYNDAEVIVEFIRSNKIDV
jgi:hypothetical protein